MGGSNTGVASCPWSQRDARGRHRCRCHCRWRSRSGCLLTPQEHQPNPSSPHGRAWLPPGDPPQHLQSWGSVGGTRLTATYCPLSLGWGLRGHGHGTASPQGDSRASGRGHWGDFGGGHSTGTGVSSFPAVPGALWLRPPGVSPRLHFPGVVSGGYWLQSHLSGCPRIFSSRYMSLIQAG